MSAIFIHSSRVAIASVLISALAASAAPMTFTNGTPISIPAAGNTGDPTGVPASIYPSFINVGGLNGGVSSVSVKLRNFSHNTPEDVDILLVAPNGTNVILMSDAGGKPAVTNLTLIFSPGVTSVLSVPLTSGTYRPSNFGLGDLFPPPAPPPSLATTMDVFSGINPNGPWGLLIVDDAQNNVGAMNGWELTIDTTQAPAIVTQPQSRSVSPGATVAFSVNAAGPPPLSYQWHVNCRDVHNGTNSTLFVTNANFPDLGNYSVTISNAFGQVTSADATLTLSNAPGPLIKTTTSTTNLGLYWPLRDVPYRLEELAAVTPPPLDWNASDEDVSFSGNTLAADIVIGNKGQRFFRVAPPNAKLLNTFGGKPVNLGEDVIFSVNATGAPPLLYQWRLNGTPILDETNSTLAFMVTGNSRFGTYQVAVTDATGDATLSRGAVLRPAGQETALSDSFPGTTPFFTFTQSIHGNTFGATSEPGEPKHAGISGGKSVWLTWKGPGNGIVTFDTIGSAFDTVLAAYAGQGFANLFPVASDDDSGSNLCSRIRFNVSDAIDYHIALDGVGGAGGFFVLSWSFSPLPPDITLPIMDLQPDDLIIQTNQIAAFSTLAHGIGQVSNVTYQWYFNGVPIPASFGSTNPVLKINGPQPSFPAQLGEYFVDVANKDFTVRSRTVSLQFSSDPQFRFVTKLLADTLCGSGSGDATNCCGASFADVRRGTPKLLAAASGALSGSLSGGGAGSASRSYWVWVTNGFTCTKSVTLTTTVKVGALHKGCTLELYSLTGIVPLKTANGVSPRSFTYTFAADTLYVIGIGYDAASPTITLNYSSSVICP